MYIDSVEIAPQTVNAGSTFIISVVVVESNYGRLKAFLHGFLKKFTHKQIGNDKLS